jgi:hypothetical protein
MKKSRFRPVVVLAAAAVLLPLSLPAQEDSYPLQWSNFKIEVYGGWARLSPSDLNFFASYEEAYMAHYYQKRYEFLASSYGPDYKPSVERTGDKVFRPIESGLPLGVRVRYQASPTFAFSAGLQYLDATRPSNVGINVDIVDNRRDTLEYPLSMSAHYRNTGFLLSATAWNPQFGAHFGWDSGSFLRGEIFILFGPLLARCRAVSERYSDTAEPTGYVNNSRTRTEISGRANGLSGELGGQIRMKLNSRVDLFCEGSYIFRQISDVRGTETYRLISANSNATAEAYFDSQDGTWGIMRNNLNTSWGNIYLLTLTTETNTGFYSNTSKFILDLSGFQLKAGFSVHL